MFGTSKVLAGILVGVFAIAMLPIAGWANSSGSAERAAECHGHMPSAPVQPSHHHQCCATGHQWAIPGSPIILHPAIAQVGIREAGHDFQLSLCAGPTHAIVSDSPPVTTSLRI